MENPDAEDTTILQVPAERPEPVAPSHLALLAEVAGIVENRNYADDQDGAGPSAWTVSLSI